MIQVLVPILAGSSVMCIGGAVVMAHNARRQRISARLAMSGDVPVVDAPRSSAVTRAVTTVGDISTAGKTSRSLREELARAGFHGKSAAPTFIGARVLLFAFGIILGLFVAAVFQLQPRNALVLTTISAALLSYIPNILIDMRRRERLADITGHLPDAIDLLEISVSAGMGMDQAWNAVTDEVRGVCPALADEMALTNLEIHLGASRPVAMRHMADRTGAVELGSLVACLVQAERFGTTLQDALRNFAMSMRETRSHKAQEVAEKMPVKMLFPMVLFIFLPAIMVMAGPAFLTLFRALAGTQ